MVSHLTLPSPTKINLFLHVTGKRPDGFHDLQTLFQFLDIGDTMQFSGRDDGEIALNCNWKNLENESNLAYRAAKLLKNEYKCKKGVTINLEKKIPTGSGLGAGSSNAATTLLALNELWDLDIKKQKLLELSSTLGSDVPIFIFGEAAWAEGRGERLTPYQPEEHPCWVIIPKVHMNTAELFSDPQLVRDMPSYHPDTAELKALENNFLEITTNRSKLMHDTHKVLQNYGEAKLSGTGAAFFIPLPEPKIRAEILKQLPPSCETFVAKSMNRSPLHQIIFEKARALA